MTDNSGSRELSQNLSWFVVARFGREEWTIYYLLDERCI